MNNKKSLLQDSLQELENIKNESLELAKEQLINESADLLEKKSAALFEKLIAGEEGDEEEEDKEEEDKEEKKEKKDESLSINEMLNELKDLDDEEDMDSDEEDSEDIEMDSEEGEMSLDALRKAAEEQGFKLVQADSDEEGEEMDSDEMSDDEEEMSDDEEEMDSDEEEMDDSDDEEDIEFNDDDEFSDVNVDDKVLAEPSDEEEEEEESFQKINENFKRNNTKMRNTKKQVLKDLRDVSFNKLVEAYYNMDEEDSFVVKENEYMDDYEEEMPDYSNIGQLEEMEDEMYGMEDEDVMYELDMPEGGYDEPMSDEGYMYEMSDEELNEMLSEMDVDNETIMRRANKASGYDELDEDFFKFFDNDPSMNYNPENEPYKPKGFEYPDTKDVLGRRGIGQIGQNPEEFKQMKKDPKMSKYYPVGGPKGPLPEGNELEQMFEEMTLEELQQMEAMLHEEGEGMEDNGILEKRPSKPLYDATDVEEDYMDEKDLTEAEIEEMLHSMKEEEEIEESSNFNSQPHAAVGNKRGGHRLGAPERRSGMNEEDFESLQEQVKKLKQENKALNEGFTNKVKSLENKVYDVTISALKAGFVNKFLLEHPLRENEKLQIIHRFANAQTKEQIKETYISLTNEFAKGQTVKDGSMLNESVQNKVGKVHRTDNAIVTEKNLMNESDESNRFKQLLNYNFGKKK